MSTTDRLSSATVPAASRTPRGWPIAALVLFAPLMAEFVLGDQYLSGTVDPGMQAGEFALFVLWYGMAALLIREVARRSGRGWPTILLLALGFALIEEGLLTQSLFNPHYLGLHLISYGYVGWLGTALPWAIFVLSIHVVWSIATPIALIEAMFPRAASDRASDRFRNRHPELADHATPWLGRVGLVIATTVLVLGGLATFAISYFTDDQHFMAHPAQLIGAALLAAIAIAIAMSLRPGPVRGYRPVLPALVVGLVLSTAYQLVEHLLPKHAPAGLTVALMLLLLALAVAAAATLRLDVTGLAAGAALTYGWVGMANAVRTGPIAILEQTVIVAIVIAVIVLAIRRSRQSRKLGQNRRSSASSIPRSAS